MPAKSLGFSGQTKKNIKEIMSNKLTRKSLAFGALVALASSAIAGAPAQAAGEG
jgi:hypothetical protein